MEKSKIEKTKFPCLLVLIIGVIVVVWGLLTIFDKRMSDDEFCEFMYGQKDLKLISIIIYFQEREVICNNPKALICMADAVRKGQIRNYGYGIKDTNWGTYEMKFHFSNGKNYSCESRIDKEQFTLCIPEYDKSGEQYPTHLCVLKSPPEEVKKMFEYLCLPNEKLKSHSLIIE